MDLLCSFLAIYWAYTNWLQQFNNFIQFSFISHYYYPPITFQKFIFKFYFQDVMGENQVSFQYKQKGTRVIKNHLAINHKILGYLLIICLSSKTIYHPLMWNHTMAIDFDRKLFNFIPFGCPKIRRWQNLYAFNIFQVLKLWFCYRHLYTWMLRKWKCHANLHRIIA